MELNLDFISKYRSSFMGLAIFWIFFYHTGIDIPGLRDLFALGWFGVDIFFFVSGFGLCASLSKNVSTKQFLQRRFFRIIPTWWFILIAMAIVGSWASLKGFPASGADYFYWFTGLGWWTGNCNFEWYIPTLLVFYLFSPFFARLSKKNLLIIIIATMVAAVILGYFQMLQHVYMSYSRIPIFITGFLVYKMKTTQVVIKTKQWLPLCLFGFAIFVVGMVIKYTNLTWGLTISRVSIPMFIVPVLSIVAWIIGKCRPSEVLLSFLGLISLEIYLLHINHEFSEFIKTNLLSGVHSYLVKMTWFAIVVAASFMIHLLFTKIKFVRGRQ